MSEKRLVVPGKVEGNDVLLTGSNAITLYNRGHFGIPEREGVRIDGFEALHLLELGRIEIEHEDQTMDTTQLAQYFAQHLDAFMLRYLVYKDLRNRGYIINKGKGSSFFFRLYERGKKPIQEGAKYYIAPLQEGGSIPFMDLEALVALAKKSKKILIFGMVDAVGDVSYLKVNELTPDQIESMHMSPEKWDWRP